MPTFIGKRKIPLEKDSSQKKVAPVVNNQISRCSKNQFRRLERWSWHVNWSQALVLGVRLSRRTGVSSSPNQAQQKQSRSEQRQMIAKKEATL